MPRAPQWLENLRRRLVSPEMDDLGWQPFYWLMYLGFLFMPLLFRIPVAKWLPATLLTVPVFLMLYFRGLGRRGMAMLPYVLAMAVLGFALAPINFNSNTYLIYAAVFVPFVQRGLSFTVLFVVGMLALYAVQIWLLNIEWLMLFITTVISLAVSISNHFQIENARKQVALRLSHEEVRRLAASAERERIGRDLHDLLGHTLSLVALKSELASRLCERDPQAARREIDEVQRVARDALAQVRHAVTGIRAAGIAAELVSAKLLLEPDGIRLVHSGSDVALPSAIETVLALVLREALTNVHRHSKAGNASVELAIADGEARLRVNDDGRGSTLVPGTGLSGMRERIAAIGGTLYLESTRGSGTSIEARIPMPPPGNVVPLAPRMQA